MQSKQSKMSSTSRIQVQILSLDDVEKVAEMMKTAFSQLFSSVIHAQSEYSIYIEQKKFTEKNCTTDEIAKCKGLFAKDFADFKEKLNEAIRARNKYYKDFRFQLAILGDNNPHKNELKYVEDSLQQLKAHYFSDKPLYEQKDTKKDSEAAKESNDNAIISKSEPKVESMFEQKSCK